MNGKQIHEPVQERGRVLVSSQVWRAAFQNASMYGEFSTNEYMQQVNAHRRNIGRGTITYVEDIEHSAECPSQRMTYVEVSFGHKGPRLIVTKSNLP